MNTNKQDRGAVREFLQESEPEESQAAPENTVDKAAVFEFVRSLGERLAKGEFDLPPFPDSALRVREALQDPDVDIGKISNLVLSEPALTARLLRMANSAALRRGPMEITDIKMAISRIGLDMVQNAAVSFAAREAFKSPPGGLLSRELDLMRRHSIRVATIAYVLARNTRNPLKPDEAMLAGLLHTVGKFYILTRADEFPTLFADRETLQDLMAQWHTGVARAIVESWEFPEGIAIAVDEQELLDRDAYLPPEITDYVLLGNLLALSSGAAVPEQKYLLEANGSISRLKLNPESLRDLMLEHEDAIESMCQAMSG